MLAQLQWVFDSTIPLSLEKGAAKYQLPPECPLAFLKVGIGNGMEHWSESGLADNVVGRHAILSACSTKSRTE